eukprot:4198364-Amphidinium_carterae.1
MYFLKALGGLSEAGFRRLATGFADRKRAPTWSLQVASLLWRCLSPRSRAVSYADRKGASGQNRRITSTVYRRESVHKQLHLAASGGSGATVQYLSQVVACTLVQACNHFDSSIWCRLEQRPLRLSHAKPNWHSFDLALNESWPRLF